MPVTPDPFWPPGAEPLHLSVEQRENKEIISSYEALKGEEWHCAKCNAVTFRSKKDPELCDTCSRSNAQETQMGKRINADWMELAAELGLEVFERQPEESDMEWRIWVAYREYYPLKLPTMNELANKVGCAVGTVTKAVQKWSFKVRLITWARYTDSDVQEKRIRVVREMNEKQLTMTQTIQEKLGKAIEILDPKLLKPNEIVSLFKVATELERRITTYVEEQVTSTAMESSTKQQNMTKTEDMSEVIEILKKTGMFEGKIIGVEQTTRVIAREE